MQSPNLKRLLFVLSLLKILGFCPLKWDRRGRDFVCDFPYSIAVSLAVAVVASFVHVIFITHTVFRYDSLLGPGVYHASSMMEDGIRNSSHLSQKEKNINICCFRALISLAIFQFFMYLFASLKSRHALSNLLNNWNELELRLQKLTQPGIPVHNTKNEAFRRNSLVCFGFLVGFIPAIITVSAAPQHPDYWLEVTINFTVWAYFGVLETLHEMVVILTLKELCNNFVQVNEGLAIRSISQNCLTPDDLDQLSDMIVAIRHNGRLLRGYLAPAQLPSLLSTMTFCVLFIFSSLLVLRGSTWGMDEDVGIVYLHPILAFLLIMRLYNKCSLAQNVTNEEEKMALELTRLGLKSSATVAQKAKMLVDIMIQKPCEVDLGSMVTLRKSLVLGAINQIATYLVVTTQFYNSE